MVGAKLSEGLNFANELARAVIVIGLPFANLGSAELQERLKYVKRQGEMRNNTSGTSNMKRDAGAELYENMCMNAVNQCIGSSCLLARFGSCTKSYPRRARNTTPGRLGVIGAIGPTLCNEFHSKQVTHVDWK